VGDEKRSLGSYAERVKASFLKLWPAATCLNSWPTFSRSLRRNFVRAFVFDKFRNGLKVQQVEI
jgi:hypothetical protein